MGEINWPRVAKIWVGLNVAFAGFVAYAAKELKRQAREANRVRWTDKNRWERD